MNGKSSWGPRLRVAATVALIAVFGTAIGLFCFLRPRQVASTSTKLRGRIPNNRPLSNPLGAAATVSMHGLVNLTGEFFKAQGENGQSCATCHIPEESWSITPVTLRRLFDETKGKHPVFNSVDANNPTMDVSTIEKRRAAYSMLLTRGVFRRGGVPRPNSEWELIAVDDPHGFASLNHLVHWRRAMPTANFRLGSATVNWDGASMVGRNQIAGLTKLTNKLLTEARQGVPPPQAVIDDIMAFQTSLLTAQVSLSDIGRLDADGGLGGPDAMSKMVIVEDGFHLFDAWVNSANPKRAQIARGQEVFNSINVSHKSCIVCHNSSNNGTDVDNRFFDIQISSEEVRTPDLPLYTFRNKSTGEIRKLTDAGHGNISGLWEDLGTFKAPTLRGLAARAPYFHNGLAATLEDVVRHYEKNFGFIFTDEERADLVAFLKAL